MILVGTSGFSFDDWAGVFYPPALKKEDRFAWYVRHFPTVEVNSTYYAVPSARLFEKMDRLTPEDYPIFVKAHGDVTHKREKPEETTRRLLRAVEPIRESGKLAGVLAQFPYSFRAGPEGRHYLRRVRALHPPEVPLFVEFRHAGWAGPETDRLLEEEGIGYCAVDEPPLRNLLPPEGKSIGAVGYVRFHGRNEENWWGEGGDRYDYLYTDEELKEWVDRIREMEKKTERTYVFFNNCHAGQAVRGAKRLQALLGLPLTGEEQGSLGL
ncbi:MAG: DUF72 domain-containing protein [Candidatus Eisenbacteria bacterium]|nr:DUF72 domain-containing protein [Candidatus Eisenbacteria bacterium]